MRLDTMPPTSPDWIAWIERLGASGLGVLASIALLGSYYGIWMWGRQHRDHVAEMKRDFEKQEAALMALLADERARTAEAKASAQRWESMSLGLLKPVERAIEDRLAGKRG